MTSLPVNKLRAQQCNERLQRDEARQHRVVVVDAGLEVLYDDREASAGEKFADADLIGIPAQLIVSEKNLKKNKIEKKNRKTGEIEFLDFDPGKIAARVIDQ